MLKPIQNHNQTLTSTIRSVMKSQLKDLIGVKCAQCSLIYPQDMIQEHLITHIQPKYLMPHEDNSGAKKLTSSIQFTDQTLSVSSADIPSLNMRQFPREECIRKDIQAPSQFAITSHNLPTLKKDIISYRGDQRDLSSRLDGYVSKDQYEQLTLTQNIDLGQESRQIRPQEVVMYKSSMMKKANDSFLIRSDKKVNPYETVKENSMEYQLVPVYDDVKSTSSEEHQSSGMLTVNIKKHREPTPRREQINTSAKKMRPTPETAIVNESSSREISEFSPSESRTRYGYHHHNHNHHTSPYQHSHHHNSNFECQQCHGFYCHHCKSTIPPQYRPANIEQHLDKKVVDFYKKHVYKGECEECEKEIR